jgi:hypothetical protein
VLFVLMPIFALLLKIFYVFAGRLYMEHMVVALHSHSLTLLKFSAIGSLYVLLVTAGVSVAIMVTVIQG